MAFDSLLILRGEYNGALVALDESDAVATSLTANTDGNAVVEVGKTGAKGLSCVIDFVAISATGPFSDEATLSIEESDNLDRNWETVVTFPIIHPYRWLIPGCVATTAFVAADVTTPRVLTASSDGATGLILNVPQALFTIGGVGIIEIEQQDVNDIYATAGDTLTATSGTGVGTQGAIAFASPVQQVPGTMVRRFDTSKRYMRFNGETVADELGTCWVRIGDHDFRTQ